MAVILMTATLVLSESPFCLAALRRRLAIWDTRTALSALAQLARPACSKPAHKTRPPPAALHNTLLPPARGAAWRATAPPPPPRPPAPLPDPASASGRATTANDNNNRQRKKKEKARARTESSPGRRREPRAFQRPSEATMTRSPSSTSATDTEGAGTIPRCCPCVCPIPRVGSNATADPALAPACLLSLRTSEAAAHTQPPTTCGLAYAEVTPSHSLAHHPHRPRACPQQRLQAGAGCTRPAAPARPAPVRCASAPGVIEHNASQKFKGGKSKAGDRIPDRKADLIEQRLQGGCDLVLDLALALEPLERAPARHLPRSLSGPSLASLREAMEQRDTQRTCSGRLCLLGVEERARRSLSEHDVCAFLVEHESESEREKHDTRSTR
eukprot:2909457-Rhodomonas_salina.4